MKLTAEALSIRFAAKLKKKLTPRIRVQCIFDEKGWLKFVGKPGEEGIKLVTELLGGVLQTARVSDRCHGLCEKVKERDLASITGAFWLPFLTALAPMGTHEREVAYTLTSENLAAFEPVTEPQSVVAKYFHTLDTKKWPDSAKAVPDTRTVYMLLGKRAAGKKPRAAKKEDEEREAEWEPAQRTVTQLTLENDFYRRRLLEVKKEHVADKVYFKEQMREMEATIAELRSQLKKRKRD